MINTSAGEPATSLTVSVLGPLEVTVDETMITIGGGRLRALLVRLAISPGQRVSGTVLVDDLWSDDPPADPANALQTLVSRLRRVLGDPSLVRQESGGYRLVLQPSDLDASRFEAAVRQARAELRQRDQLRGRQTLTAALALWRGPALGDVEDVEFGAALTVRWDDLRLEAQADLLELDVRTAEAASVISELQDLVASHPLRERFVALLITALATADRVPEALATYEQLRQFLSETLGSDPSPTLQQLHLSLVRGEIISPVAATTPAKLGNLPASMTTFVGREDDLNRVLHMVEGRRLTTIVGPGGAGKTRLAIEAARRSSEDGWREGVWLIELAPVADEANLDMSLLSTLGLRDPRVLERVERLPTEARARLIDGLQSSCSLLVIDNCEHLIEPVALLVDEILKRAPEVRIVATSREPLGLTGEGLCNLGPLELPPLDSSPEEAMTFPAVQLFDDRAAAATADFKINTENVGAVIDIVRRLDGLPLAIELAASRLRILPLSEIAQRLSDRFRLLTGGSRASLPRHRTLRAVVDWSWDLLTPSERLLAERLSVFPSGADPESAKSICGDDQLEAAAIEDLLLSLVDKSLLQSTSSGTLRYRMLETIREYGIERLAERDEIDQARSNHADHFSALAMRLDPILRQRDQLQALAALNLERDNILAALRYLCDSGAGPAALDLGLSLFWYWTLIDAPEECNSWMELILLANQGSDQPDLIYAEAVAAFFGLFGAVATGDDSLDELEERTAAISKRLLDAPPPRSVPLALLPTYFQAFTSRGGHSTAVPERQDLTRSADPWLRAAGHTTNANWADNAGDVDAVRREVAQALPLFEQIGDRWGLSNALGARAQLLILDGDLRGAISDFEAALALVTELGSKDDDVFLHLRLSDLHRRLGNRGEAHRHLDHMLALNGTLPGGMDRYYFAGAARLALFLDEDDLAAAGELATDLRRRLHESTLPSTAFGHTAAIVGLAVANEAIAGGNVAQARQDLLGAYPVALDTTDMPIISTLATGVSLLAWATDHPSDAAVLLGAAAAIRGAGDPTDPQVIKLTASLTALPTVDFDSRYAEGRNLSRADALLRIDPSLVPTTP